MYGNQGNTVKDKFNYNIEDWLYLNMTAGITSIFKK